MPSSATRAWNGSNAGRKRFGRRRSRIARTNRSTAASYSSSGLSQVVCTFASRIALRHVRDDAIAERGLRRRGRLERPRADQRLIQQVLFVRRPAPAAPAPRVLNRRFRVRHFATAAFQAPEFPRARSAAPGRLRRASCRASRSPTAPPASARAARSSTRAPPTGSRPNSRRVGADLVQRHQAVVHVERRVLDALRGDRAGDLLKLADEPRARVAFVGRRHAGPLEQQPLDEVEDDAGDRRRAPLRLAAPPRRCSGGRGR